MEAVEEVDEEAEEVAHHLMEAAVETATDDGRTKRCWGAERTRRLCIGRQTFFLFVNKENAKEKEGGISAQLKK